MVEGLRQLYRYRTLIQILILRELKARYRGSALGFLWSFVNPLVLTVIYVLVFSVYMRIEVERYPGFLLSGILPWVWFSAGLQDATRSIIDSGGLIRKVYLPSEVFPFVCVASNMIHYLFAVPVLLCVLVFLGGTPSWPLLFFPAIVLVQFAFLYALALLASSLAVGFRDLLHVVPNLLTLWFFVTPVAYPVTLVPEPYRVLVRANPMALIIRAYQDIFYYNQMPPVRSLMVLAVGCGLLLGIGFWCFAARKDRFAEEV